MVRSYTPNAGGFAMSSTFLHLFLSTRSEVKINFNELLVVLLLLITALLFARKISQRSVLC